MGDVLSFKRRNDNAAILERLRGMPAIPGTPETDADPRNPHLLSEDGVNRSVDLGQVGLEGKHA